jgi:hypothetical protein
VIKVAVAAGVALYLFCVIMAAAGFTSIIPLIVIVPVLVLLIGGGNMLGGRSHGRTRAAGPPGLEAAPLSSSGPNGPVAPQRVNGEAPTDRATSATAGPEQSAGMEQSAGTESGGGEPGDHE